MKPYISADGEVKDVRAMDKKYLVNALIKNVKSVVQSGKNPHPEELNNIEVLKEEIIYRLTLSKEQ